jgi:formate hydrogenlyase subunit 3/multisubunit Na+/H+ antiporter MnhD subunit
MVKIILAVLGTLLLIVFITFFVSMILSVRAMMRNDKEEERRHSEMVVISGMCIMGLAVLMILCGFFEWLFT